MLIVRRHGKEDADAEIEAVREHIDDDGEGRCCGKEQGGIHGLHSPGEGSGRIYGSAGRAPVTAGAARSSPGLGLCSAMPVLAGPLSTARAANQTKASNKTL